MQLKISTPTINLTIDDSDLSPNERSALAGLFGFRALKQEVFKKLDAVPKFRKILPHEVAEACPKRQSAGAMRRMYVRKLPLTGDDLTVTELCKLDELVSKLPEKTTMSFVEYTVSMYCPACRCDHEKVARVVKLVAPIAGLQFAKQFELCSC